MFWKIYDLTFSLIVLVSLIVSFPVLLLIHASRKTGGTS